jgi:zona occludens toxin (predicted ATPase)
MKKFIVAYIGPPGSGKTVRAIHIINDYLKAGKRVYTNINEYEYRDYKSATHFENLKIIPKKHLAKFWQHIEPNSIVVIDEHYSVFNENGKNIDSYKNFTDWVKANSYYGCRFIIIGQRNRLFELIEQEGLTVVRRQFERKLMP